MSYGYDENGRKTGTQRADGSYDNSQYNALGQLENYSDYDSQDALIVHMHYVYNEDGDLITETQTDSSGYQKTNSYSGTKRLIEQSVEENGLIVDAYSYTYDAGGNLTTATQNNQTETYTYTSGNRIDTYNGAAVSYDGDANITEATIDGIITAYTYDARNRLTSAGELTFGYDIENRRITKEAGNKTTTYVQNPNAALPQVLIKTTNGTSTYYIYGHGLIAEETGTAYTTYHYDLRGSTTALTDSTGLVTDTYSYGPYGELLSHTGTSQVDYLYNGRDGVITDTEDLYYMRARYYSTNLRRFTSEDTFVGKYDNLLGLNLYGYVNGNPVQYVDPSGYVSVSMDPFVDSYTLMLYGMSLWLIRDVQNIERALGIDDIYVLAGNNSTSVSGGDSSGGTGSPEDPNKKGKNKFPNKEWFRKTYELGKEEFHRTIKPEILKALRNDPKYSDFFKKHGDNPDIGLDELGRIVLKGTITKFEMSTDLLFDWFVR